MTGSFKLYQLKTVIPGGELYIFKRLITQKQCGSVSLYERQRGFHIDSNDQSAPPCCTGTENKRKYRTCSICVWPQSGDNKCFSSFQESALTDSPSILRRLCPPNVTAYIVIPSRLTICSRRWLSGGRRRYIWIAPFTSTLFSIGINF